jgi:hypothetical protein
MFVLIPNDLHIQHMKALAVVAVVNIKDTISSKAGARVFHNHAVVLLTTNCLLVKQRNNTPGQSSRATARLYYSNLKLITTF